MRWGRGLPWSRHCKFLHITLALLKSSLLNERGTHKYLIQDGLIIENMHDVPYSFNVGPEVCACMTAVCSAVRHVCPTLPLGVQILSSANQQALAVALASGSAFHQLIRKFPSSCWVFLLLSSERHDFFFFVQINSSTALMCVCFSGLDFIRAEGFVFSHVADEGLLNACAGDLLRYRKQIGADGVQIFTDIKKKHRWSDHLFS